MFLAASSNQIETAMREFMTDERFRRHRRRERRGRAEESRRRSRRFVGEAENAAGRREFRDLVGREREAAFAETKKNAGVSIELGPSRS